MSSISGPTRDRVDVRGGRRRVFLRRCRVRGRNPSRPTGGTGRSASVSANRPAPARAGQWPRRHTRNRSDKSGRRREGWVTGTTDIPGSNPVVRCSTASCFFDPTPGTGNSAHRVGADGRQGAAGPAPLRQTSRRFNAVRRSATRAANGRLNVACRPITTKSCPSFAATGMTCSTTARRRRRARLRATALPTLRLTVKPTRTACSARRAGLPAPWRRTWRIKPGATHLRRVPATWRNSERRFRRAISGTTTAFRRKDACVPWRGGWPGHGGHPRSPCVCGNHGGACGRGCSAEKCVSRVNSHDEFDPVYTVSSRGSQRQPSPPFAGRSRNGYWLVFPGSPIQTAARAAQAAKKRRLSPQLVL